MQKWMITGVGRDQAGIVAAITNVISSQGCNIEDTSMTLLEDHFTVLIIMLAPPDLMMTSFTQQLKQVAHDFHMQIDIHPVDASSDRTDVRQGKPWTISVSGSDHTGIMTHVTQALAKLSVNITHLSSKRLLNNSGQPLYLMALEVDLPDALDTALFQSDMAALAKQQGLDIHTEPLEVYML